MTSTGEKWVRVMVSPVSGDKWDPGFRRLPADRRRQRTTVR